MHSVLHKANVERSARLKQQTIQQQQQQQYQLQLQQQQYSLQQEQCKIPKPESVASKDLYKTFEILLGTGASKYFTFLLEFGHCSVELLQLNPSFNEEQLVSAQ